MEKNPKQMNSQQTYLQITAFFDAFTTLISLYFTLLYILKPTLEKKENARHVRCFSFPHEVMHCCCGTKGKWQDYPGASLVDAFELGHGRCRNTNTCNLVHLQARCSHRVHRVGLEVNNTR